MNRTFRFLVAKRTVVVTLLLGVLAGVAPAIDSATITPTSLIATVRSVDTKTQTLEVVTGVGHAVRVLRLHVPEECKITVPWAAAHITSFLPGTYVRVEFIAAPKAARSPFHGEAVSIEAVDLKRVESKP